MVLGRRPMLAAKVGGPASHGQDPERFRELFMLDVIYLVGGCAFFVIAVWYTTACDHL